MTGNLTPRRIADVSTLITGCHEFVQVPEAESKAEIPDDTQDDDLGFKMSPFEPY